MDKPTLKPPKDVQTYYETVAMAHVFHAINAFVSGTPKTLNQWTVLLADRSAMFASRLDEVIVPLKNLNTQIRQVLFFSSLSYISCPSVNLVTISYISISENMMLY